MIKMLYLCYRCVYACHYMYVIVCMRFKPLKRNLAFAGLGWLGVPCFGISCFREDKHRVGLFYLIFLHGREDKLGESEWVYLKNMISGRAIPTLKI